MHSLVFKRLVIPKKTEFEEDLFLGKEDSSCQSCSLEATSAPHNFAPGMSLDSLRHSVLPHSSTCNYGIQALINNVHRGYINEVENGNERRKVGDTRQESEILRCLRKFIRQWKRRKEVELRERERESQAKQDKILEQAAIVRENFYKEREAQIEARKRLNRGQEMKYHADMEAQQKLVEGNPWKAVALLLDLNGEVEGKSSGKSPKSNVELSTPRTHESRQQRSRDYSPKPTKKTADLSRMREVRNSKLGIP